MKKYQTLRFVIASTLIFVSCVCYTEVNRMDLTQAITIKLTPDRVIAQNNIMLPLDVEIQNSSNGTLYIAANSETITYHLIDSISGEIIEEPYIDEIESLTNKPPRPMLADTAEGFTPHILLEDKQWQGFGIAGGSYTGLGLHVSRTAGASLYRVKPGVIYQLSLEYCLRLGLDKMPESDFIYQCYRSNAINVAVP